MYYTVHVYVDMCQLRKFRDTSDMDHEVTENNSHVHTVQHTQVLPARTIAQTTRKYSLYRHQPDKKKSIFSGRNKRTSPHTIIKYSLIYCHAYRIFFSN